MAGFAPPNPSAALIAYGAQLARYPNLDNGFDLLDPVPADLLLPFGAEKYALDDAAKLIFHFAQGLGNLFSQPTLYVFKNFGPTILQGLQTGFITTARLDNSELYSKAQAELGPDNVLLDSRVIATDRSASPLKILVRTPTGTKLILAKSLLLTILLPPPAQQPRRLRPLNHRVSSLRSVPQHRILHSAPPQPEHPTGHRSHQHCRTHPLQPTPPAGHLRHLPHARPRAPRAAVLQRDGLARPECRN